MARAALGVADETAIFRRIFVSDVMNQAALVREIGLVHNEKDGPVAVTLLQQRPLSGLCAAESDGETSSTLQARAVFGHLIDTLASEGGTLRDRCVRTWIYLKDADAFYQGMVESRGAIFAEQGLTCDTHFIASTGIEGACADRYDLVAMDVYSNLGLDTRQVGVVTLSNREPERTMLRAISSGGDCLAPRVHRRGAKR